MKNSIAHLRRAMGMSQEDLAKAVGVSRQTIISVEKGRYAPNLRLAFAFAYLFDRSIEEMFDPELL